LARSVGTLLADQADAVAVTLNADAETVVLHFVKPLWAGRDLGCIHRQAELERLKTCAEDR
jgi:hypothetical protein